MTDGVYADYLVLLTNILALAEFLLSRLEQAAGDISLYMNINKTRSHLYLKWYASKIS